MSSLRVRGVNVFTAQGGRDLCDVVLRGEHLKRERERDYGKKIKDQFRGGGGFSVRVVLEGKVCKLTACDTVFT